MGEERRGGKRSTFDEMGSRTLGDDEGGGGGGGGGQVEELSSGRAHPTKYNVQSRQLGTRCPTLAHEANRPPPDIAEIMISCSQFGSFNKSPASCSAAAESDV